MQRKSNVIDDGKNVVVKLNPLIYPRIFALRVAEDLSDFCETKIAIEDDRLLVSMTPKPDVDRVQLGYEFMNHLLARIKNGVD